MTGGGRPIELTAGVGVERTGLVFGEFQDVAVGVVEAEGAVAVGAGGLEGRGFQAASDEHGVELFDAGGDESDVSHAQVAFGGGAKLNLDVLIVIHLHKVGVA